VAEAACVNYGERSTHASVDASGATPRPSRPSVNRRSVSLIGYSFVAVAPRSVDGSTTFLVGLRDGRQRAVLTRARSSNGRNNGGGDLGFEATLWQAADKLRGNLDSGEYKHVVLGLIFLKYISDAFEEKRSALLQDPDADPEDRDEYLAENVFWVPPPARWDFLQSKAKQPEIGKLLDDAMDAIEHDNPRLKGVLPKDYTRPALDKAACRRADRPDRDNRPRGREEPLEGHHRPGLRVLPRPVRVGRG
jgi:hypothetical protein